VREQDSTCGSISVTGQMPHVSAAADYMDTATKQPRDPWAHRSAGMKCSTCMWFVAKEAFKLSDRTLGRCRRHAPTMNGYPVVYEMDWCGDHRLDENKA